MENELTCCICLELYECPRILPCSHNFCEKCIKGLVQYGGAMRTSFNCPTCRKEVKLETWRGLGALPLNRSLANVVKIFLSEKPDLSGVQSEKTCVTHHKPKVLYCRTCRASLCTECSKGSHSGFGHLVKRTSEFLEKEQDIVKSCVQELECRLKTLQDESTELSHRIHDKKERVRHLERQVERDAQTLISIIESKKHQYLNELALEASSHLIPLNARMEELKKMEAESQSLLQEYKEILIKPDLERQLLALQAFNVKLSGFITFRAFAGKASLDIPVPESSIVEWNAPDAVDVLRRISWNRPKHPTAITDIGHDKVMCPLDDLQFRTARVKIQTAPVSQCQSVRSQAVSSGAQQPLPAHSPTSSSQSQLTAALDLPSAVDEPIRFLPLDPPQRFGSQPALSPSDEPEAHINRKWSQSSISRRRHRPSQPLDPVAGHQTSPPPDSKSEHQACIPLDCVSGHQTPPPPDCISGRQASPPWWLSRTSETTEDKQNSQNAKTEQGEKELLRNAQGWWKAAVRLVGLGKPASREELAKEDLDEVNEQEDENEVLGATAAQPGARGATANPESLLGATAPQSTTLGATAAHKSASGATTAWPFSLGATAKDLASTSATAKGQGPLRSTSTGASLGATASTQTHPQGNIFNGQTLNFNFNFNPLGGTGPKKRGESPRRNRSSRRHSPQRKLKPFGFL